MTLFAHGTGENRPTVKIPPFATPLGSAVVDFRQLELFVAVAEEEHVTNGARRVHVTQSTASAAVRRLEDELGVELFQRIGRRVALTYAGNLLLERARLILGEARRPGLVR